MENRSLLSEKKIKDEGTHFRVIILGAGTGGICTAAKLVTILLPSDIAIVDSADHHDYQPYWTLVGAGVGSKEETRKPMSELIPKGVNWVKKSVVRVDPVLKAVFLNDGSILSFDFLVVATGLRLAWEKIKGAAESLGKNNICTIYEYDQVDYVYKVLSEFNSGRALFIMPPTPIKCAGAPQKIMYLADNIFRNRNIRNTIEMHFYSAGKVIFGVPEFAKALDEVVHEKNIKTHYQHKLVEINSNDKIAKFEVVGSDGSVKILDEKFDMIHVVPPMSAHSWVDESGLAFTSGDQKGWLEVNRETLQHVKYPYIFGVGDVTGVPNSKTGAAIRKQYPIVVDNLIAQMKGLPLVEAYDGYSACPLIVEFGKVILAEFGYESKLMPSFPFKMTKPSRLMWILKKNLLPKMYWSGMLKGKM